MILYRLISTRPNPKRQNKKTEAENEITDVLQQKKFTVLKSIHPILYLLATVNSPEGNQQ